MLHRLIWLETRRLITQYRFAVMLVVMLGLSIYQVYSERSFTDGGARFEGAIAMAASDWLPFTTPLVVGVVAAGSFAEDRRRGYVPLVLARGFSRRQYIVAKGTAMALTSALAMLLGCLIFLVVAAVGLLPGRTSFESFQRIDPSGQPLLPVATFYPGPIPSLFGYSPILNDMLSIGLVMLAAAALAMVGLLTGAIVANEYIAAATPFFLVLITMFAFVGWADALSLYTYLDMWIQYRNRMPRNTLPYAILIYWPLFGFFIFSIADMLFTRRELI